jgi:hypothetical protein
MSELKMCECGEPTYSEKCQLCFSDEAVSIKRLEKRIEIMNHRIRELEAQCWIEDWFDTDKFAELIVKECADQIKEQGTEPVDWDPSQTAIRAGHWDMAKHIMDHFGVK